MNLTQHQISISCNVFDMMFTENKESLAFAGQFGIDTMEELWMLRDELRDHIIEEDEEDSLFDQYETNEE